MRTRETLRTALVVVALALAAGGCRKVVAPPDGGTVDGGSDVIPAGAFLAACATDADCDSGVCLASHVCSKACAASTDCPQVGGWSCDRATKVCACQPTGAGEVCNGRDDDCNGVADDHAPCPGLESCEAGVCACPPEDTCGTDCVDLKTSPLHCGRCDNACAPNETCGPDSGGQPACSCPGKLCGSDCVDPAYDDAHCGGCDLACGAGQECVESVCRPVDREWTSWTPAAQFSFAPAGSAVRDQNTGLVWATLEDSPLTLDDAKAYCDQLVVDDTQTGWRLPTRAEVLSLVDYSRSNPAISTDAFPDGYSGPVWTATAVVPPPDPSGAGDLDGGVALPTSHWAVDFSDGSTRPVTTGAGGTIATQLLVRCVR